jgi:glycosidase
MPGGDDPDNRHDFPGGFPGDSRNAFTSGGRTLQEEEIFAHVQSLLRLRQAHPALRGGRQQHIGWDDTYYAFLRQTRDEKLLVVFNNAPEQREVRVPLQDTVIENAKEAERLFGEGQAHVEGGTFQVELPATSVAIYLLR